MQKWWTSWPQPTGANHTPGQPMLSLLEKHEAEMRTLERLRAQATESMPAHVMPAATPQPLYHTFSFLMTDFNSQQLAVVHPATESTEMGTYFILFK